MTSRRHAIEVEVPGTPEQVWDAIATGPGITAWFVPTDVEPREGGAVITHLGSTPDRDSRGEITAYEPPHRFAYVERWDDEDFATEFLVEARDGATCIVRIVSSGFGDADEWDRQMEGLDSGWRAFLDNLRVYLRHFAGAPSAQVLADASSPGQAPRDAMRALLAALGLPEQAEVGASVRTAGDAPPLAGVVERVTPDDVAIRIHEPSDGLVVGSAFTWDVTTVRLQAYLYGTDAAERAARMTPAWRAWLAGRFAGSAVS
jgi:uncharacterized protein YndB with AHSA1/START domain